MTATETRVLSRKQEQALRLVHHDHNGLSVGSAAVHMGITIKEMKKLLRSAKRLAPQMFPILTPEHQAILMMRDQHKSNATIAAGLHLTLPMLKRRVAFLREHGFLRNCKVVRYQPNMDSEVVEKF